jgi:hypothetical protein
MFGAISTVSWYGALFAALFKSVLAFSLSEYVLIYVAILSIALIVALYAEYRLSLRVSVEQLRAGVGPDQPALHHNTEQSVLPMSVPAPTVQAGLSEARHQSGNTTAEQHLYNAVDTTDAVRPESVPK